jgi:hypothetical protein
VVPIRAHAPYRGQIDTPTIEREGVIFPLSGWVLVHFGRKVGRQVAFASGVREWAGHIEVRLTKWRSSSRRWTTPSWYPLAEVAAKAFDADLQRYRVPSGEAR